VSLNVSVETAAAVLLVQLATMENILVFDQPSKPDLFHIASSEYATAILLDSKDDEAIHIAANTFADDVERVSGRRPTVHIDSLPKGTSTAIVACTSSSALAHTDSARALDGQWEAYDIRIERDGAAESVMQVVGSDKVTRQS
jgi:hypothetical protein